MATSGIKWYEPNPLTTMLSTGLDSLANGVSNQSSTYNNAGLLDTFADFQLQSAYAAAVVPGTKVAELYLLPMVDGSTLPTLNTNGVPQSSLLVAAFQSVTAPTGTVETLDAPGITIPPGNFRVLLRNTSGQAFQASNIAKTLKMQPYQTGVG